MARFSDDGFPNDDSPADYRSRYDRDGAGGYGGGGSDACFNCGQEGHRKIDCPEPPKAGGLTGACHNCGEVGHNKADCSKARNLYDDSTPDMEPAEAWELMQAADAGKDAVAFKDAMNAYTKAMPDLTLQQMETELRAAKMNFHLVAKEQEIADTMTIVNLQGMKDCKYVISFQMSYKPTRPIFSKGWPKSPEDNMERLADAGYVRESFILKCRRCEEVGHTWRACTQELVEREKPEITCSNCSEKGHYVRDCPQPRQDRNACRNCGQSGHKAADCTEERSTANVECRHCNEMGHFAKDCPTREPQTCRNCGQEGHRKADCTEPFNPANVKCNNCDETGHMSRECPKPRDYSRISCRSCGEKGHTSVRCKNPAVDSDDAFAASTGNLNINDDNGGGGFEPAGNTDNSPW